MLFVQNFIVLWSVLNDESAYYTLCVSRVIIFSSSYIRHGKIMDGNGTV
jgi:hypothetical protein